eukprot:12969381-Ditylum_brightwellii.AAC.1
MGMISSSFNSWRHLAMLAFKLDIIKRSSLWTANAIGSLVSVVKGNSELVLLAIIAPVVVKFEHCDAMGVVQSNLLSKFE